MFLPLQLPLRSSPVGGCLGWAAACRELRGCRSQHLSELLLQFTACFPWLSPSDYAITCLLIPTGKLDPLVARLMGATTATLVGEGADCRFLGGNAGGGLQDTTGIDTSITLSAKRLLEASQACFPESLWLARLQAHRFLSKAGQELLSKIYPLTNINLRILSQVRSCSVIYFLRLEKSWYFSNKNNCCFKKYF